MAFSLVDISSVKSTSILSQVDLNSSRIFSQGPQYLVGIWNTTIRNPETLEIRTFWMWDFKWSGFSCSYSYSPNYLKNWTIQNLDIFIWISNGFWQNGGHLSGFQMVGLPDSIQNPDHLQPNLFPLFKIQICPDFDPHCSVLCYSKGGYLNCLFGSTECVRVGGQILAKMA